MRKFIKWTAIILVSLIGLVVLVGIGFSASTNARLNKVYSVQPETISVPTDPDSIKEGERLTSIYCASCHGADFGGTDFFNDPVLAVVDATNLTAGDGGIGAKYADEDWVRAIRHGIGPDGKALFIMPSKDFYYFSNEDLGQIIAYLESVPPVDRESTAFKGGALGKVLIGMGIFGDVLNAETIAHDVRPLPPIPGVSVEYGEYLANTFGCRTCHGENLAGGPSPDPDSPLGSNLTPGGNLGNISSQAFITMVRARKSDYMPFESLAKMSDDELTAIWMYLQSLPELEANN
jgi:mono/diheme cytochrome c family protein